MWGIPPACYSYPQIKVLVEIDQRLSLGMSQNVSVNKGFGRAV